VEAPSRTVTFQVLGPFEVVVDGRAVALGGARQRLVLAALVARANAVVATDRLIDIIWGDEPSDRALSTLQKYVHRLRSLVGADRLLTRAPGYLLCIGDEESDASRFESLLASASRLATAGDLAGARSAFDAALALWRGPAWAEFADYDFARAEVARLEGLRDGAVDDRVEVLLGAGRHADVVGELEATVGEYPLRERPRAHLILALYRCGRHADALRAYEAYRRYLGEEVGLEPSALLVRLADAIVLQKPELDWAPPPNTPVPAASVLPSGTVTFLFTDIAGSTRHWDTAPDAMRTALERHDVIVREAIARHGGAVFSTGGDGFGAAFARAGDACAAATDAQTELASAPWPEGAEIRVRMGLHTGEVVERDGDYFGAPVNQAARLMALGHGGQVLCSAVTAGLLDSGELIDLGEHRLRDLSAPQHIFQVGAGTFPTLRSLDASPGNLPVQTTRFVGRAEELGRVAAGLDQSRLVTLTGVGGVGKTRLALQAAAERLPPFPDGAWLVELAGLIDPATVAETVRAVLGVQAQPGRSVEDCLAEFFSARCVLVVLDNCEHLIGAAAALALRLVSSSGASRVLATSREGLGVAGERVIAIPPLAVPSDDTPEVVLGSDAVRLFVERAAEARDGFSVSDDDAPTLARLCQRLDGIPLAIELAAARVRSFAPTDLLAHLDQRFRLLSAGRRTAPTRQQTLRNAINWSHELLGEPERVTLRRLSVFAGGFNLAAVEAVAADVPIEMMDAVDLVDRLVDKSLVTVDLSSGATRYRMLDTIRDYGRERLAEAGETATFARRHAEYFAAFAERAGAGLRGPEEGYWSHLVGVEMENLRLALRWAIDCDEAELALRLVGGLAVSGYPAGCPFGATALDAAALGGAHGHPLRALALSSAAWTALHRGGDHKQAAELGEAALREAPSGVQDDTLRRVRGEVLSVVCAIFLSQPGFYERTVALVEERRAIAVDLDDDYQMVQALLPRAPLLGSTADAEEAVRLARMVANPTHLAYSLTILAMLVAASDPARARTLLEEAVQIAAAVGNQEPVAIADQVLATVLATLGDQLSAARMCLASAEQLLSSGDRYWACNQLFAVAASLFALGDQQAALLLGAWVSRRVDILHMDNDPMATTPTWSMPPSRPAWLAGNAEHWVELMDQLTPERLLSLDPQVTAMTDEGAIALARASVDHQEASVRVIESGVAEKAHRDPMS
jgi:predicted ATPase/class 3 adenylate cyclase